MASHTLRTSAQPPFPLRALARFAFPASIQTRAADAGKAAARAWFAREQCRSLAEYRDAAARRYTTLALDANGITESLASIKEAFDKGFANGVAAAIVEGAHHA